MTIAPSSEPDAQYSFVRNSPASAYWVLLWPVHCRIIRDLPIANTTNNYNKNAPPFCLFYPCLDWIQRGSACCRESWPWGICHWAWSAHKSTEAWRSHRAQSSSNTEDSNYTNIITFERRLISYLTFFFVSKFHTFPLSECQMRTSPSMLVETNKSSCLLNVTQVTASVS